MKWETIFVIASSLQEQAHCEKLTKSVFPSVKNLPLYKTHNLIIYTFAYYKNNNYQYYCYKPACYPLNR